MISYQRGWVPYPDAEEGLNKRTDGQTYPEEVLSRVPINTKGDERRYQGMEPEVHERRQRIWRLLVEDDLSFREIIETVADDFETTPETIEEDLQTIDDWLPELDLLREVPGIALLAEVRQNRRRLHRMAEQAHDQDDLVQERKIRSEINRSLNIERQLGNSDLEITHTPPQEVEDLLDEM